MSRNSRAAIVVAAAVLALLVLLHLAAPQWMASMAQAIHGL